MRATKTAPAVNDNLHKLWKMLGFVQHGPHTIMDERCRYCQENDQETMRNLYDRPLKLLGQMLRYFLAELAIQGHFAIKQGGHPATGEERCIGFDLFCARWDEKSKKQLTELYAVFESIKTEFTCEHSG